MAEVTRDRHGIRGERPATRERPVTREREVVVERERRSAIGSIFAFFAKLAAGVVFAIGLIVLAIIVVLLLIL